MESTSIETFLLNSVISAVPQSPDHNFTLSYKLRKRRIINLCDRTALTERKVKRIRLKYIFLAIILAAVAALSGFGIFKLFEGFRITDYDTYSMLSIVDDLTHSPDAIEEKFYIDMDMSGYETEILNDIDVDYTVIYKSESYNLTISQETLSLYSSTRLNTENVVAEPASVSINGWNGIFFTTHAQVNCYIFNTREYVISYTGNMAEGDMESIIKATRFE